MRQTPRTSFANLTVLSRKPKPRAQQQISIAQNRIQRVIGKIIHTRCVDCSGIPRMLPDGNVTGFYPISMKYPHRSGCRQAGRF